MNQKPRSSDAAIKLQSIHFSENKTRVRFEIENQNKGCRGALEIDMPYVRPDDTARSIKISAVTRLLEILQESFAILEFERDREIQ